MSPAITRPEFKPTRNCNATPSRRLHLGRQPVGFLLDGQRGQAPPKSVILQRNWGAEERHHAVAGVLNGPAVSLRDRRRALQQLGHDLAQPFHIHGGREVH